MKRQPPHKLGLFIISTALGLSAIGCGVSYDSPGPRFALSPMPEEGTSLVYLYRPAEALGASWSFIPILGGREFTLWAGHYGAFVVPEGLVQISGDTESHFPRMRSRSIEAPLPFQAKHGAPVFLRARFESIVASAVVWKFERVDQATALREMAELRLAPGGRPRYQDPTEDSAEPLPRQSP